eukprot:scaffold72150_cov26-Tisochrysis_lutea.AAC.2
MEVEVGDEKDQRRLHYCCGTLAGGRPDHLARGDKTPSSSKRICGVTKEALHVEAGPGPGTYAGWSGRTMKPQCLTLDLNDGGRREAKMPHAGRWRVAVAEGATAPQLPELWGATTRQGMGKGCHTR